MADKRSCFPAPCARVERATRAVRCDPRNRETPQRFNTHTARRQLTLSRLAGALWDGGEGPQRR